MSEKSNTTTNTTGLLGTISVLWVLSIIAIQGFFPTCWISENAPSIVVSSSLIYVFLHGYISFGIRDMIFFFCIVFVIANIYENMSIAIGFPFSFYHYTDKLLGPKVIYTPVVINIAYFHMAYLVWIIIGVILDKYESKLKGLWIVVYPMTATFIMVMWDMVMDPYMSTMNENWIWHQGGAYFGVPFQNFIGWFLCVYTMFQVFALWLSKFGSERINPIMVDKKEWLKVIGLYLNTPLLFALMSFTNVNRSIIAKNGQVWNSKDIVQSGCLVSLVTMVFISFLVIVKMSTSPLHNLSPNVGGSGSRKEK